jgi:murein DD-endopeptidase MepM/ murein hydrolase activator NlpD
MNAPFRFLATLGLGLLTLPAFAQSKGQPIVKDGTVITYEDEARQPATGIDISSAGKEAFILTDGEVISFLTKDGRYTVIVKGPKQIYVYGKLTEAWVKKGDEVKAGQKIGLLSPITKDKNLLHFEVWTIDAASENTVVLNYDETRKIAGIVGPN